MLTLRQAQTLCPKHMHNGPCGGVRVSGHCEASNQLPCPYLDILEHLPWRNPNLYPVEHRYSSGKLEHALRAGAFVTIAEVYTPDSADLSHLLEQYLPLQEHITAVNIAEHALATPHTSTLAAAHLFEEAGIEAIINLTCRDRNRIALQGEILGAAALGIKNIFCITGDHPKLGDHPEAKAVFDLDSLELIGLVNQLRSEGKFLSGRRLTHPPNVFIGCAASPFSPPITLQAERVATKVARGANFIQTQAIFDLAALKGFIAQLKSFRVLDQAYLIVGIALITSLEQALWLKHEVPGTRIPDSLINSLSTRTPRQQRHFGLDYAKSIVEDLRTFPGVSGVLLFPLHSDTTSLQEFLIDKA